MLDTPSPIRASPFCSSSLGPQLDKSSELLSTSASRSLSRSERCRDMNALRSSSLDSISADFSWDDRMTESRESSERVTVESLRLIESILILSDWLPARRLKLFSHFGRQVAGNVQVEYGSGLEML